MYMCLDCQDKQGLDKIDLTSMCRGEDTINSIISNFQVCSHGILVNDVHIAHGGKQTITRPNGTTIPIFIKEDYRTSSTTIQLINK